MGSEENRLTLSKLLFKKAGSDLESAKVLQEAAYYSNAVFLAQQCGEKAAKAVLALLGLQVREHTASGYLSTEVLSFAPMEWEERLRNVVHNLVFLEEHTIKPRYPLVTAARVWDPEKAYDKTAGLDAIQKAEGILQELRTYAVENLGYKE